MRYIYSSAAEIGKEDKNDKKSYIFLNGETKLVWAIHSGAQNQIKIKLKVIIIM